MREYRLLKLFIFAFLLLYFVGGLAAKTLRLHGDEFFPVFSWFLFERVPFMRQQYAVQILSSYDRKLPEPVFFAKAKGLVPDPESITAYILIQDLGRAIAKKQPTKIANLRLAFEENYLFPSTDYKIVEIAYNPIDRFKNDQLLSIKSIKQLRKE